jgi:two-component system C4-dicarboxylate transport sensor histidine kinase DctB
VEEQTRDLTAANIRLTREIEQHRRTAIELQQAQDALIQSAKLAVIGQLSTGISHELNQPLAAIRSYADNARALLGQERWEDVTWNLRQISELTERMAQISTQLKIFARKTSGQQVAVSLSAVLDDSLELFVARIRETGTEIRRESQRDLQVLANRVQLEQVLVNLIGNALHAVEAVEKRFIEFHVAIEADRVRLTMRDSGPGIDLDILNRIFDPFFTTKEEGRGLGLGLSISQRIVEVMEGELNADNHPDGGARFTLYLQQVTD